MCLNRHSRYLVSAYLGWSDLSLFGQLQTLLVRSESFAPFDMDLVEPLFDAVVQGEEQLVLMYLHIGAHINAKGYDGQNVLHWAAASPFGEQLLSFLINKGADITAEDKMGYTPLHLHALRGRVYGTSCLLQAGAPVNVASERNGFTPLHLAILHNHIEVANILLAYGADHRLLDNIRDINPIASPSSFNTASSVTPVASGSDGGRHSATAMNLSASSFSPAVVAEVVQDGHHRRSSLNNSAGLSLEDDDENEDEAGEHLQPRETDASRGEVALDTTQMNLIEEMVSEEPTEGGTVPEEVEGHDTGRSDATKVATTGEENQNDSAVIQDEVTEGSEGAK